MMGAGAAATPRLNTRSNAVELSLARCAASSRLLLWLDDFAACVGTGSLRQKILGWLGVGILGIRALRLVVRVRRLVVRVRRLLGGVSGLSLRVCRLPVWLLTVWLLTVWLLTVWLLTVGLLTVRLCCKRLSGSYVRLLHLLRRC